MNEVDSNRNLVASLSYILGFITGIVILLVEKEDKFIRFHAVQSSILSGGLFALNLILSLILRSFGFLNLLASFINIIIWMVIIITMAVSFIKAYQGQLFKWPIVGDFAEKQV